VWQTDRQTDGQTSCDGILHAMHTGRGVKKEHIFHYRTLFAAPSNNHEFMAFCTLTNFVCSSFLVYSCVLLDGAALQAKAAVSYVLMSKCFSGHSVFFLLTRLLSTAGHFTKSSPRDVFAVLFEKKFGDEKRPFWEKIHTPPLCWKEEEFW